MVSSMRMLLQMMRTSFGVSEGSSLSSSRWAIRCCWRSSVRRPIAHAGGELAPRLALAGPGADGRGAIELDQLEQLLTALLEQDLAHQRAERVHILAQRLVLGRKVDVGAVHGVRILAGCGAAGRGRVSPRAPREIKHHASCE